MKRVLTRVLIALSAMALVCVATMAAVIEGVIEEPHLRLLTARIVGRNFGESIEGVYRMGQPKPYALPWIHQMYGFKTVINLAWLDSETDRAEKTFFAERGVDYHAYTWKPEGSPADAELDAMIELIRKSPKPVLVHCIAGADRTGGVVGIWEMKHGKSLAEVEKDWERYRRPSWGWRDAIQRYSKML